MGLCISMVLCASYISAYSSEYLKSGIAVKQSPYQNRFIKAVSLS